MVGQFHPHSIEPGIYNQEFRPTRCPVPVFAIRFMVPFDLPFLLAPEYLPEYEKHFGSAIPKKHLALYQQMKASTQASY